MFKTTIVNGAWVQVPATLVKLAAGKWNETINGVDSRTRESRRKRPIERLNCVCFTPEDQKAFRITAPWWAEDEPTSQA